MRIIHRQENTIAATVAEYGVNDLPLQLNVGGTAYAGSLDIADIPFNTVYG